jgi:hypothetical protein
MIHIATVHWRQDKWIDLQLNHLKKNLLEPYRVYTYLTDISEKHDHKFHHVLRGPCKGHSFKLNWLAEAIAKEAKNDTDLLIFLDGDAFPIRPFDQAIKAKLTKLPLAAVVQKENFGDCQPHPSFCITTVGLWQKIKGDWTFDNAKPWHNSLGLPVIDVGAKVLQALEESQTPWLPILRSNRKDLHPLWFGVYGDFIYHHGSGFREPTCRKDELDFELRFRDEQIAWVFENSLSHDQPEIALDKSPVQRRLRKHTDQMQNLSDSVFAQILKSDRFFETLL